MNKFFQKVLIWAIALTIFGGIMWYVTNNDIQSLGDSHIAFTIEDLHPRYSGASLHREDYYSYVCEWISATGSRIMNPSPQRCILHLTNLDTGQEFTVRHRDHLSGEHYKVVRKNLDGETISTHELTIR